MNVFWDGVAGGRGGDGTDDLRKMTIKPSECAEKIESTTSSTCSRRKVGGVAQFRSEWESGGRSRVSSRR